MAGRPGLTPTRPGSPPAAPGRPHRSPRPPQSVTRSGSDAAAAPIPVDAASWIGDALGDPVVRQDPVSNSAWSNAYVSSD